MSFMQSFFSVRDVMLVRNMMLPIGTLYIVDSGHTFV